jgi:hypothetical protein
VTEKIVLHSSAHGVEASVGDPDDVKGIGHANRVIEMRTEPGTVGLCQIGGDDLDALESVLVAAGAPSAQVFGGIALHHVDHQLPVQVDQTGGVDDRVPSATPTTLKPSSPSSASARPVPSLMSEVPSSKLSRTTATMSGPLAALVDGQLPTIPSSTRRAAYAASSV